MAANTFITGAESHVYLTLPIPPNNSIQLSVGAVILVVGAPEQSLFNHVNDEYKLFSHDTFVLPVMAVDVIHDVSIGVDTVLQSLPLHPVLVVQVVIDTVSPYDPTKNNADKKNNDFIMMIYN